MAADTPSRSASRRPRRRRKSRAGWWVGGALLVLFAIVAVIILQGGDDAAVVVEVESVAARYIVQSVTATGVIEPETQVVVSPEVSGEIIFLNVAEGDRVRRGQVIARIDPAQSVAQLDASRASIAAARARLAQAQAAQLRSESDLRRLRELHSKKLATDQELDAAESQVKIGAAEVDAARFQVQQAQANFRQVEESVSKTTVTAPLDGTVTQLNSKLGEKVVGAIQMTGTAMMTIADLSVIEVVVDVSETDVVQVGLGDTAFVEIDAIPNEKFRGYVTQIANSPKQSNLGSQDQLTSFPVRVRLVNPDPRLRPGMTATATIETDRRAGALSVPIQSVTVRREEEPEPEEVDDNAATDVRLERRREAPPQPIVFVVRDSKVIAQPVGTGIRDDQFIEVTGLKKGQMVVSGPYKAIARDLSDGDAVRVDSSHTDEK